ncbi:protein p13 MTCP-1-like [Myotis daubentonii]|uniref:protein p13 MTCP-1-like n=1 Tax=Myotis daubentonii TaxID=98922 RepID=UPI0028731FB3|nr:protein p13 MTCP-1-like [Myotis daubentonii]
MTCIDYQGQDFQTGIVAELPSKVHLTSHPILLRIHEPSVYKDETQRTWLHLGTETGRVLKVRLRQEVIPSEDIALITIPQISGTMPSMWSLQFGSRYLDSMGRFWRIVHHVKEDDIEEMILELMEES